jgi:hypothetical protein
MRAEATDAYTPDGRYIIVVYEEIDDRTIMPSFCGGLSNDSS